MSMIDREKEMTTQKHQTAYLSRIRFARTGSLAYVGHLDMMRAFERAIRRTELPLLHSQGYNPRPMLVFALPIGVGIHTTDDYVDIAMSRPVEPREVMEQLASKLPPDLSVLSVASLPESVGSIMAAVSAASYELESPGIVNAAKQLLDHKEIVIEKPSKGKMRTLDIRPLIHEVNTPDPTDPDRVEILVRAGSKENLRPDLFLSALVTCENYSLIASKNTKITRTGLFSGTYPDIRRFSEE